MKKKAISLFLSLVMCLTLLPNAAMATDVTPNPIGGVQIRDTNNVYNQLLSNTYYLLNETTGKPEMSSASADNYHVYYDNSTRTLTLKNAGLKGPLFVPGGTIVELVGTNSVGTKTDKVTGSGIEVDSAGSLTVQGDGSLATYCTTEAITNTQSGGSITIREATLTLAEWQTSIYSRFGSITITDGADVTANDIKCAPTTGNDDGDGHIVISGDGTKVTAVAINTTDGKITISEKAVVEAVNNSGAAISGQTGVEVKTGAKVTAKGSSGAISAFRGDLDLDGEVYAEMTGGNYAALSVSENNSINIKGKLTLVSKYTGAWAPGLGNITIDNGEVTVTANFGFITRINSNTNAAADGGNLIIKNGSKVSITGAMGIYMLQNKGVLTVDSSTLEINSSSWGIYNGGEVKMINSAVTCTPTNANNKAIGTSKIDYQYDNGYTFMAGDDANSAAEIPAADQTANLKKSYVQITPKSVISVTGVELNKTELSLIEGNTETLIATVAPTDATNQAVTWTSNNPAVATVDENGVVTAVAAGSATITATTKDGSFTAACVVTVSNPSSSDGGSSSPSYAVIVSDTQNGTVKVSPRYAERGDIVTATVTPDEGYTLETLTVTDRNGKEIEVKDLGNGKYSFKMPASKVTVNATFEPEKTVTDYFADVPADSYYADAVLWAANEGVTGGIGNGLFAPNETCTRAQIVTFLWRAAGCPVVNYAMDFSDVGNGYYTEAVRWAASLGIVGGYGNGLFGTDDTITREQMVTILYRFAQHTGMDTTQGGMAVREYSDYESISDYALSAMQWAVNAGILQGYNNNLMPGQPCTRAQIMMMLYRLLG